MSEKSSKWLWWGVAGLGLGAFLLSKRAKAAAGLDPLAPPPVSDPNKTRGQLLEAWATWIPAVLAHYGYVLQPSYGGTTYQIADKDTGDYMKLVQRNQGVTDAHLGFWWKFNEAVNTKTADLNNDATWSAIQADYQKLVNGFTPAFFAK